MTDWNELLAAAAARQPHAPADDNEEALVDALLSAGVPERGAENDATLAARGQDWLVATGLVVAEARGEDARAFLQAQFCNDLGALADGGVQVNGYCSPKGRLLALFAIRNAGEGVWQMFLPAALADGFVTRLRMFVLRAKVTLEIREDLVPAGHIGFVLEGSESEALLDDAGENGSIATMRWPAPAPGFRRDLVIGPAAAIAALAESDRVELAGFRAWDAADIAGGMPQLVEATREAFVPQMMNLQQVEGLSFRKGCYPGQEIVARMQYLGRLKRHMRRYRIDALTDARANMPILTAGDSGDAAEAGRVVVAVRLREETQLLAVVRIDATDTPLALEGHALRPVPMPYAPPEAASD